MFVVTLLACQASPPQDSAVGAVLQALGAPQIERASTSVIATPGQLLQAGDVIHTHAGMVIVQLTNQHVVRLDEDIDLAIEDLALWGAPATTVPAEEQLAQLLYPGEVLPPDMGERIAGWQGRLSSGTAVNAVESAKEVQALDAEEAYGRGASEDAGSTEAAPSAPFAPSPIVPPRPRAAAKAITRGANAEKRERKAKQTSPPKLTLDLKGNYGGTTGSPASRMDDVIVKPAAGAAAPVPPAPPLLDATSACLTDWHAGLGLEKKTVHVDLVVRDGKVVRIRAEGGLTLPRCARDPLLGTTVQTGQLTSIDLTFAPR